MNDTNVLARALQRFLGDYLPHQRAFSVHTIWSYRDSLKLLLQFVAGPKRRVADLTVIDLTPAKIIAFLDHLEAHRGNDATTRNVRLSAIHSFFDYLGAGWPEHLDQVRRVLAITFKRTTHRTIDYLEAEEVRTLLEQIDRRTVWGRRDYVLLALMFNTGARVQEIVSVASAIVCDGVATAAVVFAPEYGNEDDHQIRSHLCSRDCAGSTSPDRLAPEA